jgi:hypothetical protein
MQIRRYLPENVPSLAAVGLLAAATFLPAFCVRGVEAQAAAKPPADAASGTGSIETEMLTYRALESNSEAIACDIARYLNGVSEASKGPFLNERGASSKCNAKPSATKLVVVILPFDKTQFADLQIWRADMATMDHLQTKAALENCPSSPARAAAAAAAVSSLLSGTPAGPPLALAQAAFSMLASEQSNSSVGGTIHDQAFIDGVGRELRSFGLAAILPSSYSPNSVGTIDETKSPYLASRNRTLKALSCLQKREADTTTSPSELPDIKDTIARINDFISSAGETTGSAPAPTGQSGGSAAKQAGGSGSSGAAPSHMASVLTADGLAQQLGVDPDTGMMKEIDSQHILLVEALESGGTVGKSTNVLGTKYSYSGGSVGTYALFKAAGDLECSGNVYDYAGPIKAKQFETGLHTLVPDPSKQVIFLHSCAGTTAAPPPTPTINLPK